MRLKDIDVGGCYLAKVSGASTVVRVVEIKQVPGSFGSDRWQTRIVAVNEASGRRITIRSPQRLQRKVED